MTSKHSAFFLLFLFFINVYSTIVIQCTDVYVNSHSTPDMILKSIQQCFEQSNQPISITQNIETMLNEPLNKLTTAISNYNNAQEKISNEDFDTRRSIQIIQKEIIQYYFEMNTKINQIQLPNIHHASMEHIFFKIKKFLQNSNQTVQYIGEIQKSIQQQKQKIQNISSDVLMLNTLRQIRTEAQQLFEMKLEEFRNAIRAQFHEKLPQ